MSPQPASPGQRPPLANLRTQVLLGLVAILALAIRVAISYRAVMGQEYVAFIESDAWYHMRLVDSLIERFPWRIWYDPYLSHPGGELVNVGPMFDWIVAGVALLVGAGSPSPRLVDVVGAFVPPVLGALAVIPVFLLGRDLFSRRAGLWAALCAAVLPGDFLLRSALGFTDHHCAEVLFTTVALWCVVRAIDARQSAGTSKTATIVGGLSLGMYLLTWSGGALFVAALAAWGALEVIAARLRDTPDRRIVLALVAMFGIAALVVAPSYQTRDFFKYDVWALCAAAAGLIFLAGLGSWTRRQSRGTLIYLGVIAAIAATTVATVLAVSLESLTELSDQIARLSPFRDIGYVSEAAPLMRSPDWRPFPLWNQYTTSLILAIAALPWVLFREGRTSPGTRLLLAWGVVSLAATIGQVRFVYYLAVPVVLLAGRACDLFLTYLGLHGSSSTNATRTTRVGMAVAAILVVAISAPGYPQFRDRFRSGSPISADWFDALQWMRTNTPEPFGAESAYTEARGADAEVITANYSVMAWWDYGYLITRIARRVPVSNPRQSGLVAAARFFLETDPAKAAALLDDAGARYVIADAHLQMAGGPNRDVGFMTSIAEAAGIPASRFCETFITPDRSAAQPALYCFPEYYRTMAVRLYAFDAQAVTPRTLWVLDLEPSTTAGLRRIRRETLFTSVEAAERFVQQRPASRLIAAKDQLSSPVPLDAMPNFKRAYRSVGIERDGGPSLVQIFEHLDR